MRQNRRRHRKIDAYKTGRRTFSTNNFCHISPTRMQHWNTKHDITYTRQQLVQGLCGPSVKIRGEEKIFFFSCASFITLKLRSAVYRAEADMSGPQLHVSPRYLGTLENAVFKITSLLPRPVSSKESTIKSLGVKLGLWRQGNSIDWGCLRTGFWE
jgi:hypothetical protein